MKTPGNGSSSSSGSRRQAGSKSNARLGAGGGGGGRKLAASTTSTRNASAGGGGRNGRVVRGKRRGAVEGAAGWGQEEENALEALKSTARVVSGARETAAYIYFFFFLMLRVPVVHYDFEQPARFSGLWGWFVAGRRCDGECEEFMAPLRGWWSRRVEKVCQQSHRCHG